MSRSKLQDNIGNILRQRFGEFTIRENYRPQWLTNNDGSRLELDFFIEELRIAIEVQGDQHYKFVPFFHKTHDEFSRQLDNDDYKRTACDLNGIKLFEVSCVDDIDEIDAGDFVRPIHQGAIERRIDCIIAEVTIDSRIRKYIRIINREREKLNRQERILKYVKRIKHLLVSIYGYSETDVNLLIKFIINKGH